MPWDQLGIYLYNHSHQGMAVRGDGFCFLNAIDMDFTVTIMRW